MKGSIYGVKLNGQFIPCETNCEINVTRELLNTSGSAGGSNKSYIYGYSDWTVSVDSKFIISTLASSNNNVLLAQLAGQTMTLMIAARVSNTQLFELSGTVLIPSLTITLPAQGEATSNIKLQGTGILSTNIDPDNTPAKQLKIRFGTLTSLPVTDYQIDRLTQQPSTVLTGTINTINDKIFVVTMPISLKLNSITDLNTGEDLLSKYVLSEIRIIDGIHNKVYIMQNSVPYSTNHKHSFVAVADSSNVTPPDVTQPALMYYGYSAIQPTTAPEITSLPASSMDNINPTNLLTGNNRIFTIAIAGTKSLQSVIDTDTDEDLTGSYLYKEIINVNNIPYKIYTLINAIPFTTSHTHKFSIKNG